MLDIVNFLKWFLFNLNALVVVGLAAQIKCSLKSYVTKTNFKGYSMKCSFIFIYILSGAE